MHTLRARLAILGALFLAAAPGAERAQQNACSQRSGEYERCGRRVLWDGKQGRQPVTDADSPGCGRVAFSPDRFAESSAEALGEVELVDELSVPDEALLEFGGLALRQGALQIAIDHEVSFYVVLIHEFLPTPHLQLVFSPVKLASLSRHPAT